MTWKELGTGLQAVRDGEDLPYRVAEGLIGLGYILPGPPTEDFKPTLTCRGRDWLDRWERIEIRSGLLARRIGVVGVLHMTGQMHDPRD